MSQVTPEEAAIAHRIRQTLHSMRSSSEDSARLPELPHIYTEETTYEGRPYDMPLVTLNSRRCRWLRYGGGCVTCNYNEVATIAEDCDDDTYSRALLAQVERATEIFPPDRFPFWTLSTAGSFFDDSELPHLTRLAILRRLRQLGYQALNFESRPEYCRDEARLTEVRLVFGGAVSVSIGLESYSDSVRTLCVNKGYSTQVFLDAARALRRAEFPFNCYVLLGKPLLGAWLEDDGTLFVDWALHLAEAQGTLHFAFANGAYLAILMLANLQPGTLSYRLFRAGCYELPSSWLAVETIRGLQPSERHRVVLKGLMRAMPHPLTHASTCPTCIGSFRRAHMAFNEGAPFDDSLDAVHCRCRTTFLETLRIPRNPPSNFDLSKEEGRTELDRGIRTQLERNVAGLLDRTLLGSLSHGATCRIPIENRARTAPSRNALHE